MKDFKTKLFTLSFLAFTQSVFAFNAAKDEVLCPSVDEISKAGMHSAFLVADPALSYQWEVNTNSRFHTQQRWSFTLSVISAKDEKRAITKANKVLETLVLANPLAFYIGDNTWKCVYGAIDSNMQMLAGEATTTID